VGTAESTKFGAKEHGSVSQTAGNLSYEIYFLTPWNKVLLEKPGVAQLLKNFPIFYRTGSFITMFTTARQWFLS
jgi:hypothetical protein